MTVHRASRLLLYLSSIFVAAVIVWGFFIIGTPSFNRKVAGDRNRLEDLKRLKSDVEEYYNDQKKLPEKLTQLEKVKRWAAYMRNLEDTMTKKPYEYSVSGQYSYELCADFELPSKDAELERERADIFAVGNSWDHDAGHQCFAFEIPEAKRSGAS